MEALLPRGRLVAGESIAVAVDTREAREYSGYMVTVTFADRDTEKRALAFLLGRFSGRVLRTGEHLIPEAALEALAHADIPFTVQGKTTYAQQLAAVRSSAPPAVQ